MRVRLHGPSMVGRARTDAGLLALTGLVVALVTLVTTAVGPLTDDTSDRTIAAAVRDAGPRAAVVATTSDQGDDGERIRDPQSADEVRASRGAARAEMPADLASAVRPGVTSLTTPPLQLLDAGPGRYLRLAYLTGTDGAPATTFISGRAPAAGKKFTADPWPVQVALPEQTARALDLGAGDRVLAEDQQHRQVMIEVTGVFAADRPGDDVWAAVPDLLHPVVASSEAQATTSGAALASDASLPDLRLAVPTDDLTSRTTFVPQASRLRWDGSDDLVRAVISLKATRSASSGSRSWDSLLDGVLTDARERVSAGRGQANALVIGLVSATVLVLLLAAGLLVRRRTGVLTLGRERGAALAGTFAEAFVEAATVAVLGAGVGVLATWASVGHVGWLGAVPVLLVASLAYPALATAAASRAADTRRVPANRSARRAAVRARRARRLLVEAALLATAVVTFVALQQRGVAGGDVTGASAPTWWAVAGGLAVVRLLPIGARLVLGRARRAGGAVPLVAAARLSQLAARTLPVLAVVVTVAQLTFGVVLVGTEQRGQSTGALIAVGGDARLRTVPDRAVADLAARVAREPGVTAAVAARVTDGVQASAGASATTVRLVVVDSAAYQRLLALSPLDDRPALGRLRPRSVGDEVPGLLRGGDAALSRDGLRVRWQDQPVAVKVVGEAPQVGDSTEPVLVVDRAVFAAAAAGTSADPDTVWAVGAGAAAALRAVAGSSGSVDTLADVLHQRRSAALASGLVRLALASSLLLAVLAVLAVVLEVAAEAGSRATYLGRLRSLGLGAADTRRALRSELVPVPLVAALAGIVLGVGAAGAMFGRLSLDLVTGQSTAPALTLTWWIAAPVVLVVTASLLIAALEARRVRRASLAALMRGGGQI